MGDSRYAAALALMGWVDREMRKEVAAVELDIYVHGKLEDMDPGQVLSGMSHLVRLINALGGGQVRFSHLHDGSVDTAFRAAPDTEAHELRRIDQAFRQVVAGLRLAEERAEAPEGWDDSAVRYGRSAAHELTRFTADGFDVKLRNGDTILERVRVTTAAQRNLDQATKVKRTSIGSVIGRLDSASHDRREARLVPEQGSKSVTVRFAEELVEDVRLLWGHRVEARGKLVRDYLGHPVSLQLRALTKLKTRDETPPLASGAGIAPNATTSSVKAYLEAVRDSTA